MTLEYSYHAVNLGLIVLGFTYIAVAATYVVYEMCTRKRGPNGYSEYHYCFDKSK